MKQAVMRPLAAIVWIVSAGAASAHDTWLMPLSFAPAAGKPLAAVISAGDGLKALTPPKRKRVQSLELVDAHGRQSYRRWADEKTLARINFGVLAPGLACLAYSSKEVEIGIVPKLVDEYLAEIQPGADINETWQRQRARGEPWRERYAKDAKTYLRSRDTSAGKDSETTGWPQLAVLGQTLEIVPVQDPTRLAQGSRIDVLLQHQGRPLADIALRLFSGKSDEELVRTDADGRASFKLKNKGRQLIATTLLNLPASPGAPWTSRFATMGFSVDD